MDWITINKTEGRGSAEVKVTAPTYRELVDRMTRLKISTLSKTAYVSITQEKITPIFELSKNHLIFSNDILEENINITSNIEWTATVSNDWITLSSYNGDGNSILTISLNENDTTKRTGSVEFYNNGILLGSITITYNLFYVEPTEIDMTDNLTATINVTSNMEWSVEYNSDWFSVSPINGNGDGSITVTANAFNDVNREAIISFIIDGEIKDRVRIYQSSIPENCFYIEPYNEGESVLLKIKKRYDNTNYDNDDSIEWFNNVEWKTLPSTSSLRITRRCYIRNYNRSYKTTLYLEGLCNIGGNIETLLGEINSDKNNLYDYSLFIYSDIVDASNLLLPATTLTSDCYNSMFSHNTYLITPPQLPATTLANNCYYEMFEGCTSLTTPPELPATIIAPQSYFAMFRDCPSLTTAPALPATELGYFCYSCMFENCTNLTTAPELPATTLANGCYEEMFNGCISLVNAPILPATNLTERCYDGMLQNCKKINNITMLATNIGNYSLRNWVDGVSPTGIFYKNPNMNDLPTGINGIPEGWEVRDYEG